MLEERESFDREAVVVTKNVKGLTIILNLQTSQPYKSAKYSIPKPLGLWEEQENMNIAAVPGKNIFRKLKRSKTLFVWAF